LSFLFFFGLPIRGDGFMSSSMFLVVFSLTPTPSPSPCVVVTSLSIPIFFLGGGGNLPLLILSPARFWGSSFFPPFPVFVSFVIFRGRCHRSPPFPCQFPVVAMWIEPTTLWFVAQYFNHCAIAVPRFLVIRVLNT
jgi:hypothetical protein